MNMSNSCTIAGLSVSQVDFLGSHDLDCIAEQVLLMRACILYTPCIFHKEKHVKSSIRNLCYVNHFTYSSALMGNLNSKSNNVNLIPLIAILG